MYQSRLPTKRRIDLILTVRFGYLAYCLSLQGESQPYCPNCGLMILETDRRPETLAIVRSRTDQVRITKRNILCCCGKEDEEMGDGRYVSPAERLVGIRLDNGWSVVEPLKPIPDATGGNFSRTYIVQSDGGTKAFLKALDFTRLMSNTADPPSALKEMMDAHVFERDICRRCADKRLTRVVRIIGDGTTVEVDVGNPMTKVPYLIFEYAEGDIRTFLSTIESVDTAWKLRVLHNAAIGLQQLHNEKIAHQDLKPSNVLVFEDGGSKIADLGRASTRDLSGPYDTLDFAGDFEYAPPEILYHFESQEWGCRRLAPDLYLLGNIAVFLFTGSNMTALVASTLAPEHHWNKVLDFEEVLPYYREATSRAFEMILKDIPEHLRENIRTNLSYLCEPDPRLRGHPLNRAMVHGKKYGLDRFVAAFNLLAEKAAYNLTQE